ncbi:MAG: oxaloacetate decarboxylase subunit alpha [Phycisphaera sp.]|nr:oxaloacetate decarboxylase subunit alpha [Phycisphaera sp.]
MLNNGKINLIDCSLRDGHQSLLATRMSTEQCLRVLPMLRDSGYSILELWGGATLDSALRFTGDDPFERLSKFKGVLGDPAKGGVVIRSLCRGQNLFGYTPYPDNVVVEFLKAAVRSGSTRMRVFDALNDPRNLITAIMATKTFNGHAEAALSYTTSPVHDTDHFLRFARAALDWGADSLAIKDMAGLLHPFEAYELIEALRKNFPGVEITLHSHCTNGLAVTSYVVGMILGVDHLDTCYGPMAGSTAQPPAELIKYFADELGITLNVKMDLAPKIDAELRKARNELAKVDKDATHMGQPWPAQPSTQVREKVQQAIKLIKQRTRESLDRAIAIIEDEILVPQGYPEIDRKQLEAQVPGGMISNLHNQLKEQGKLDQMPRILDEVPRVRKAAGYVPLVTPTSQIVGTQAAFNVIQGEPYAFVSEPFRDLLMGKYGKLPGAPEAEVLNKISRGQAPITCRPADLIEDVDLEKVYRDNTDLIRSKTDLLLLLLFPMPAKQFLQKRAGAKG